MIRVRVRVRVRVTELVYQIGFYNTLLGLKDEKIF